MVTVGSAGFWSYAHDDDKSARGAILQLADAVKEEYDLLTGAEFNVFVDRDALAWGEIWRERVDASLKQTTFFIAIITPRYFSRPECRREFIAFLSQAKSLGLQEYLLPILFVGVADLAEDSSDELKAAVARTQFVDWRALRLLDRSDSEYRRAVNGLVERLIEIEARLAVRQLDAESAESSEGEQEPVVLDELIGQVEQLLPEWHESVISSQTRMAQIMATHAAYDRRVARLKSQRAPRAAHLSEVVRLGRELDPLVSAYLELARTYSRQCIELDPLVTAVVRYLREHPQDVLLIHPIALAVDDAHENIEQYHKILARETQNGKLPTDRFYRENARFSRTFHELLKRSAEIRKLIGEGNEIVKRWREAITAVSAPHELAAAPHVLSGDD
jgi:hypothetical protein